MDHGETQMSSDHGETRWSDPESWSSDNWSCWSTSLSSISTGASTPDTDALSRLRRLNRSPSVSSLPVRRRRRRRSPAPNHNHNWVLLNRAGARLDYYSSSGDHATAATSRTSTGHEITVSFELVDPPGTSVLTVDDGCPRTTSANVIAAHRDFVLLAITSRDNTHDPAYNEVVDLFVYQAASRGRRRRPSLLLLPSAGGPVIYSDAEGMGIMSYTSSHDHDDDESPSFVVAYLELFPRNNGEVRVSHMFLSGSGKWRSFENVHVRGANGGRHLRWWSTDAVVPYGRRYMLWVDYYRGMVVMDLSSSLSSSPEKKLRYVPLPVDTVGNPVDIEYGGRGCPKASRSVCVTRYGVKFVSVDAQHWSNFGVGHRHVLKWSHRFRVTTWWLTEEEDDTWRWRRDVTVHEDEFWDAFDGGRRFPFPHVQPEFPVVDVDNPDVVVFRLTKPGRYRREEERWMIEVDLRRKALLAATVYSKESDGLSGDAGAINSARMESDDPIPSELPRYLEDGGQSCKKRRRY